MILVREVSGPAKALAGGQATYQATKFNVPNPPAAEVQQISWIVKKRRRNGGALQSNRPYAGF